MLDNDSSFKSDGSRILMIITNQLVFNTEMHNLSVGPFTINMLHFHKNVKLGSKETLKKTKLIDEGQRRSQKKGKINCFELTHKRTELPKFESWRSFNFLNKLIRKNFGHQCKKGFTDTAQLSRTTCFAIRHCHKVRNK